MEQIVVNMMNGVLEAGLERAEHYRGHCLIHCINPTKSSLELLL